MRKKIVMVSFALVAVMAFTGLAFGQMGQQAPNDDMIKAQISKAIQANPGLSIGNVMVDSKDGNVTLSGKVANRNAEKQIVNIAAGTPGVKSVKSNLEVYQQK
jgi:osmotically-inducible protein OsmY